MTPEPADRGNGPELIQTVARRGVLWIAVLLAVLLRAGVVLRSWPQIDDPDNYVPLARAVASGEGFALAGRPTAYRPPLYPLMLAPLVAALGGRAALGVAWLHIAFGAGTVWLTAVAAKGSGMSPGRVAAAAFVTACDPVLVWQSCSVMTETPAAFLVAATLAGLCATGWRGPVLGGLWSGLAALCRPSLLPGAVVTILASLLVRPGRPRVRLARALLMTATLFIVLLPWTVRNYLVFGEPIWATTHGGYTLALANNRVYYTEVLNGPPGRVWTGDLQWQWWDSVNRSTAGMSEPVADRYLRAQFWLLVRERPADFVRSMLARLGHFWSVAPAAAVYPERARWATVVWTVPLWVALVIGLGNREAWHWPRIGAAATCAGLTLVHLFFWTDLRMRAPIVPAIALLAAGACMPRARAKMSNGVAHEPPKPAHGTADG
jgi:hypothetical protein